MRTKCIDVYKFSELSDEAKAKAIRKHCNINVDFEWWDCTYEDAARAGIKITSFDFGRRQEITGKFTTGAKDAADLIIQEHGETCETRKTAGFYLQGRADLLATFHEPEEGAVTHEERYHVEELDKEFLRDILSDYLKMLREEYEYQTKDEQIKEAIEANEMEFTIDGKDA